MLAAMRQARGEGTLMSTLSLSLSHWPGRAASTRRHTLASTYVRTSTVRVGVERPKAKPEPKASELPAWGYIFEKPMRPLTSLSQACHAHDMAPPETNRRYQLIKTILVSSVFEKRHDVGGNANESLN